MSERIAIVTGASRGLGAAMAEELALRGWQVVAVARTVGGLEELDDRVKRAAATGGLTLAPMDVTDEDAMRHLCRAIYDRWGRADLWVHSAIHAPSLAPAGSIDAKDASRTIAVNIAATAALIPMIEPLLQGSTLFPAANGTALFFDDPRAGQKFFGLYGASKAAQIALAGSWQAESRQIGPRVLIEAPQPMPTATRSRFFPGEDRGKLVQPGIEAVRICDLILI
jgi:NAD(P)-dependent dehydrogenase (short-subunit alcohol dehydrogenase family)